jgi:uncharacterized protein
MKQDSLPLHLDVKSFARATGAMSGQDLLSKYERIMEDTEGLGAERSLDWGIRGEMRVGPAGDEQAWLHLAVQALVPLTCQRCLRPADMDVMVDRAFRFVDSEALAEAQDDEAEEDVLVLSREFNLRELIEDELLMALPLVPRHETCPVAVKLAVTDPDFEAALAEKTNPFAVLAKLREGKS